jgi:hypothetical protein
MEEMKKAKALFQANRERKEVEMSSKFYHKFQLQSSTATATLNDNAPTEETVISENIAFVHEGRVEDLTYDAIKDNSFVVDKSGSADLGEFLSRPVPIATFVWAEGSSTLLQQTYQPWDLFFNDTRIKKKLDNFAFINCTLKLKFVINASPFYYGSIGAFYRPLSGLWDNLTSAATVPQIQIPVSQRPHVWMNPQEVSTAEMTLPFFKNTNWLDATLRSDFQGMGTLDFWQFSKLRSANGAVGAGVTITVYAWAENVVVAGPTVSLALQSRISRAESRSSQSRMSRAELQAKMTRTDSNWWKPSGQISQVASRVATVAPVLGKLGAAGEYAGKTIEAAANTVGSIASLFGFSNTPVIEDTMPFKSLPFHSLASTEISEPVERLTIDPKQALDLDSTVVGLDGTDELGISYINQKESFLCGALWQDSFSAGTLMFSSRVLPALFDARTVLSGAQRYDTPMAYVSQMFQQWRGDIIFRFKFIRSMYHRGRVRITWDPSGNISTDPNSTTVCYTQIVDLDIDDEVELRVPYIGTTPFKNTKADTDTSVNWTNTSGALAPNTDANGTITIRVLNSLTGPVTGTEMDILVFVRGAENLEYANPRELNNRVSPFVLQSGQTTITNGGNADSENIYGVCYGERYASLRQILHRSSRCFSTKPYKIAGLLDTNLVTWFIQPTPSTNGYDPQGMHMGIGANSAANARCNFIPRHPLAHVQKMFIGRRGSFNWHFNLDGSYADQVAGIITVERAVVPGSLVRRMNVATFAQAADSTNQVAYAYNYENGTSQPFGSGATGLAMTNQNTQAGVSVNIPDYNNYRFHVVDSTNQFEAGNSEFYGGRKFAVSTVLSKTDYDTTVLHAFASAGPDYNLLFWMNTPDNLIYTNVIAYSATEAPVTATITP